MKKSELKAIVKEEISNILKEDIKADVRKDYESYKSKWKTLESAIKAYKNEIKKMNSTDDMNVLKDIERQLVDFNIEMDELIKTYGYGN